jgi:hypothetical protein
LGKNIPAAAGLAGGSSDAAAVLAALDQLYPQHVSREQLFELAARIGADVPFCLLGGTALGEGVGEILTPLPAWEQLPILLCKPNFGIHTSWVFKRFRLSDAGSRPDRRAVLEAVQRRDLDALAEVTGNVLESVSLKAYPELRRIKNLLTRSRCRSGRDERQRTDDFRRIPRRACRRCRPSLFDEETAGRYNYPAQQNNCRRTTGGHAICTVFLTTFLRMFGSNRFIRPKFYWKISN